MLNGNIINTENDFLINFTGHELSISCNEFVLKN